MWHLNRQVIHQGQGLFRLSVATVVRRVLIGAVGVVLSYGCYWIFTQYLVVRQVVCYVSEQQLTEDECSVSRFLVGKSIIFTRFDDPDILVELQKVTTSNQLLYYAHLRKSLPYSLRLYYQVTQPVYSISSDQAVWAIVNQQGVLKVMESGNQLPKVFCSTAWGNCLRDGNVVEPITHHWVSQFLAVAESMNRPVAYIGLDDQQQVSILFRDGRRILVTKDADPSLELTRLKLIEQESSRDERFSSVKIKEIDLRFRFPVLRT